MTKLNNLNGFLKRLATNNYKQHEFIREWRLFIFITIILKLAGMVFSIFAGYFYFYSLFLQLLNSPFTAKVFSGVALIIIEVLTALSLSKFFKFALRLKIQAIPIFLLSVFFFVISFVSSTNGLSLRQSTKKDNTTLLQAQYDTKKENINKLFNNRIRELKTQIQLIKNNPQGWKGSKRVYLLNSQLNKIDKYINQINRLENDRAARLDEAKRLLNNSLATNKKNVENEAAKYYDIVSIMMFLIFFVNGLLMFFYSKIFAENQKELSTIEVIKDFSKDIETKAANFAQTSINNTFALYFAALQNNLEHGAMGEVVQEPRSDKSKKLGFNFRKDASEVQSDKDEKSNARTHIYARTPVEAQQLDNQVTTSVYGSTTCVNCNKEFIKKSHNHKFCSELCRLEYYEKKTNKNIDYIKKLYK